MTTHEPKKQTKSMRRAESRLARRIKVYNEDSNPRSQVPDKIRGSLHKPGSNK